MFAVIEIGGHQYRVKVGDQIQVEKLPLQPGASLEIDRVLMVGEGERVRIGQPVLPEARVRATVLGQVKGEKIIVFKYRPGAKRYRRKQGHRQTYTVLRIEAIETGALASA
ncbi:50S ribosomal protein L21 [Thermoflexus sp.]|uniref:50S ribosomal protein L21 n=1 Tax=Thermoflexus sp. TaxID=1969742 RepID=UPI0025E7F41D|nr:50S ribosomal protein L21 [Thermoflexus sp.]MDW8064839.1 50S ribosomal protein L21 [Anaerolineae bacterium]MCS6964727.1 50S ribosomal protein L21 [Thermoflexus sp.]MCS7350023.1 50S ribosomal protein L21 [Thermoflexus sp.]MCX7690991.1 50S ribosomal protein L21 [Thermoflexus sp.]MDW8179471.1 50S ribosomal protein L21 [Anaerolineae bacterium]